MSFHMKNISKITQEMLRDWLEYYPETGEFVWKKDSVRRIQTGNVAGYKLPNGRIKIFVLGEIHYAYRLAWLYVYGKWPSGQIDHINRITADNRIINLREATASENIRNRVVQSNNKLGIKGVCYCARSRKYVAQYNINGKPKVIGSFNTLSAAGEFYKNYVATNGCVFDPL